MHILFVCTGNICRSPTAERLARRYASQPNVADFSADSAGIRAVIDEPMHPESARVLELLGGESEGFVARQLNAKMADRADLILGMTRAHRDAVLQQAPRLLHRTFTLWEASELTGHLGAGTIRDLADLRPHLLAERITDVRDPIGHDAEVFRAVGAQIADLLQPVLSFCSAVAASEGP